MRCDFGFLELQSHGPRKHFCLSEPHSHHLFLSSKSRPTRLVNGKDQFLWLLSEMNISNCSSNALHHLTKPVWGEMETRGVQAGTEEHSAVCTPGWAASTGGLPKAASSFPVSVTICLQQSHALSFSTVVSFSCMTI